MSKSGKVKLNNSGSTLVMSILAIAFISLLASVIMAAAVGNIVMKQIDATSKDTFYTAESVVDEIKVGVGKGSLVSMADAYEEVLSNLIVTGGTVEYMMDNTAANDKLKALFMQDVAHKLTNNQFNFNSVVGSKTDTTYNDDVKAYLSTFIAQDELLFAQVKSIESVTYIKDYNGIKNTIIINNVVVNYKAEKNDEVYFADVTFDINIAYPNMEIDFTGTERLKDYTEYALIADYDINVGNNIITTGVTAEVAASMYAGQNIIITSNPNGAATLKVKNNIGSTGALIPSDVVTRGDLRLKGAIGEPTIGNKAYFSMMSSNLWCGNIEMKKDGSSGIDGTAGAQFDVLVNNSSEATTDELKYCSLFVEDDMNLEGRNSIVNIDGSYYGYSNKGVTTEYKHELSSAIIVSGAGSHLNMGTTADSLKNLVIGGHSYISYKSGTESDFMTGEAISFKGDQEVYLIPPKYLGVGYDKSVGNPMSIDAWDDITAATGVTAVDVTTSFAYTGGLLDSTPYTTKTLNGLVYVYYNFTNKDAAATYIKGVIAGSEPELQTKLNEYTKELMTLESGGTSSTGSVNVTMNNLSQLYSSGALMMANGGTVSLGATGSMTVADFATTSIDLGNRYDIITHLLVDLPFVVNGMDYNVLDKDQALLELKLFTANNNEFSVDATVPIVDWDLVRSKGYNDGTTTYLLDNTVAAYGINVTKVVKNGDYIVPSTVSGGVIIANGTVTLDHDFKGMIIASGSINILGNASITTNVEMVEMLIQNEFDFTNNTVNKSTAFKNYLHAFKSSDPTDSNEIKIESLGYDDLVSLDNWRKFDDGN